ncbi:prenyltransferase/squalene oxidase repeat-containing protein [Nostoc sp. FACHB-888]|uniref:prenyltransferase/squalene oxidase repeat-containing protein n=1 Tax=Nostoc sp. FACHB-888 TaxID=2692842 RepID=UPI0016839B5A|nr:prenyltransferase/squalene oxidase repeat-containing protein [Nostoc sp. FACHB-888]MBD2248112.1 hypothetical protein [Nostoc sp. FACHB-888]
MTLNKVADFSKTAHTELNTNPYVAPRSANSIVDLLISDLRSLLANLGKDGGLISPSIYDTAQLLRFYPPDDGVEAAIEWLLKQQQADGGWGNLVVPLHRDVPTLASVLTLHSYKKFKGASEAFQAGLNFLWQQADQWRDLYLDDLPVASELILPCLLKEADAVGLELPQQPYTALITLGNKRRQQIAQLKPQADNTTSHSWEAWGMSPDPSLIDRAGGIGHSPAATAAWLYAAANYRDLVDARITAERYLAQAAAATDLNIPGVVPTVWSIDRYEQIFSLESLLISGLLDHPALQDLVDLHVRDLASAVVPKGIGMSSFFVPDGDNTAAAVSVLYAVGNKVDLTVLRQFENDKQFVAYFGELHSSISVTARAVRALASAGEQTTKLLTSLIERQHPYGYWASDKWQSSWLYTTLQVALALLQSGCHEPLKSTYEALLTHQHIDGGWGTGSKSTTTETSYAVLTLYVLRSHNFLENTGLNALWRGYQWLLCNYRPFKWSEDTLWIGKELYCPYRIDRAFELSTMLALALEKAHV